MSRELDAEVCDGKDISCKVCRRIAIEDAIRKSRDINIRNVNWDALAAQLSERSGG